MIMVGAGGTFSVVGSRVASQAARPHQEVALAISLLTLRSKIGSAIGSAFVTVTWSSQMSSQLRAHLPVSATDKDVKKIVKNVKAATELYAFDSPMRQGIIQAYRRTLSYALAPVLALALISLVAACFQTNFYLGKQQNAVANVGTDSLPTKEDETEGEPAKSTKNAFVRFWAGKINDPESRGHEPASRNWKNTSAGCCRAYLYKSSISNQDSRRSIIPNQLFQRFNCGICAS